MGKVIVLVIAYLSQTQNHLSRRQTPWSQNSWQALNIGNNQGLAYLLVCGRLRNAEHMKGQGGDLLVYL